MLNAVQLPKQTSGLYCSNYLYNYLKLLNAVRLPKQTTGHCTITEANNWTQYNYLDKLLNAVQLPKRITERCTIT